MKISKVHTNYFSQQNKTTRLLSAQNLSNNSTTPYAKDSFVKSKAVSFGDEFERFKANMNFDPINASEAQLDEYAEFFHDNEDFYQVVNDRYWSFWRYENYVKNRDSAFDKLRPRIEKVKQRKNAYLKTKTELTEKQINADKNLAEQKTMVKKEFLNPLELNTKYNNTVQLPAGILLYGNSTLVQKDEFQKWLKKESAQYDCNMQTVSYNPNNSEDSFKKIIKSLEDAKLYNKITGKHTILNVDGIDKLLTNLNDFDAFDYIDYFKNIVEVASKNYNTTILLKTNIDLDDFDSASISDHRFPIKINLIEGLTPEEQKSLNDANSGLEHLKEQTEKGKKMYRKWTEYVETDWGPGNPSYDIGL